MIDGVWHGLPRDVLSLGLMGVAGVGSGCQVLPLRFVHAAAVQVVC